MAPPKPNKKQKMNSSNKLKYFDISWFSSVDGSGSRVVLFLQGCHLRCPWCHAPHSWHTVSPLLFFESSCQLCGSCVDVCANKVHSISKGIHHVDRGKCKRCGSCIESCPTSDLNKWNKGALGFAGKEMEVHALYQLLKPQLDLLKSIGGLTISGGEPLLQSESLATLLKICSQEGIHTTVETSATLDKKHIEPLLPLVDHWLIGIRPSSADKSSDWDLLLENIKIIAGHNPKNISIRTPIISGYTNTNICYALIKEIMLANEIQSIEILPANPYAGSYYKALGMEYPMEGMPLPDEKEMRQCKAFFDLSGIEAKIVN